MNNVSENHSKLFSIEDENFMRAALALAVKSANLGEVPVGAVIVQNGIIISEGWNSRETAQSCLGHAEIMAIKEASLKTNAWRLSNMTLYVTLEPCIMCAGAISQARIPTVIYGAQDPKGGACGSLYNIHEDARLNHRFLVKQGLIAEECGSLLTTFFRQRRRNPGNQNSD